MFKAPPSEHFQAISLEGTFNQEWGDLSGSLGRSEAEERSVFGRAAFRGIPFALGAAGRPNVLLLDEQPVVIELGGVEARYILFLHAVADQPAKLAEGLTDHPAGPRGGGDLGNPIGGEVSAYRLEYVDGGEQVTPVRRRYEIQQRHITWGASPFAAVPYLKPELFPSSGESRRLNQVAPYGFGEGETRHVSGRGRTRDHLWLFALINLEPSRPIKRVVLIPREERSLVLGITVTKLSDHPLRPGVRQKLRLTLPDGAALNAIDEVDGMDIDLGTVISARAALDYDAEKWASDRPNVQPEQSKRDVIVEYAAHPQAKLYVKTGDQDNGCAVYDLAAPAVAGGGLKRVNGARRPVRLRVVEKGSDRPVPVRLHLHGEAGEYLPPKNHHRRVNRYWFEDMYGEFVNGLNEYCYIPGECEVDLPLGEIFVEISRGYEVTPIRTSFTIDAQSEEVSFELERTLDWRAKGWVTADTHVHFLSPQTALLEGSAEGINVVNLLASQWGEMFSNVGDFDGRTTLGEEAFGGDGEFLVRVGTENRMQVLGHISLLGYSGPMILPLCTGGPGESAIGDPQEVTMAEWAQRCIQQNGLVVMPHAPNPQAERAADMVLGLVHAVEMMTFNPFDAQISPYGLADWYRYLNLGYHIPVVGGSDKMSAASLLGGVRTYAHLGERPFTYEHWMAAVRGGNTFVTVGPLAELTVEGLSPGSVLSLPAAGGTVQVNWKVESTGLPIDRVEIVMGGLTVDQVSLDGGLTAVGSAAVRVDASTWIALRVRGSYQGNHGEIAAHTSAVQLHLEGKPIFSGEDATLILEQIEGAMAYVDIIAPRPEAARYKQLRATLAAAHNRLHQRMHQQGIYHEHGAKGDE